MQLVNMKIVVFTLLVLYQVNGSEFSAQNSVFDAAGKKAVVPLRIMTFNIWKSGTEVENGLYKVAKHIRIIDPDIVALQVSVINCMRS